MNRHKNDAINGVNKHLYNGIRKHGFDNFVFSIIDEAFTKEELDKLEVHYIQLYDTFHGYGYNETVGGSGFIGGENHPMYGLKGSKNHNHGRKHTEEWKLNHSKFMTGKDNPFYGKHHSGETKDKIAESKRGKKLPEEHRINIILNTPRFKGKDNPMAKSVVKLDKEGNLIAIYDTIKSGAESVNGDISAISRCCRGGRPTAYGFKWMYKNDFYKCK